MHPMPNPYPDRNPQRLRDQTAERKQLVDKLRQEQYAT